MQLFDGLELHHHLVVYQQVDPIAAVVKNFHVTDWQLLLPFHCETRLVSSSARHSSQVDSSNLHSLFVSSMISVVKKSSPACSPFKNFSTPYGVFCGEKSLTDNALRDHHEDFLEAQFFFSE